MPSSRLRSEAVNCLDLYDEYLRQLYTRISFGVVSVVGVISALIYTLKLSNPVKYNESFVLVQSYLTRDNLSYIALLVSLSVVLYYSYAFFIRMLWIERLLTTEQHQTIGQRRYAKYPQSPFPNGWYKLCDAFEISIGEVKQYRVLGQDLVLFRQEGDPFTGEGKGKIACLDAICPHLGANLGGGTVRGNCISCPFHAWEFNGQTGSCDRIPYAEKVPESAKTTVWHVREQNQTIYVWYDIDNQEPTWEVPNFPEISSGKYKLHGRTEHEIICHIQEMPENGADNAHLDVVHGAFLFPALRFLRHHWAGLWVVRPAPESHLADFHLQTKIQAFGRFMPGTTVNTHVIQAGVGIVFLQFPTLFGKVIISETVLPVAPNLQRTHNQVWAEPGVPRFVAKFMLKSLVIQFERDIPIWNNKRWLRKPMPVKEDGPLLAFRRFTKQFYSDKGTTQRADAYEW